MKLSFAVCAALGAWALLAGCQTEHVRPAPPPDAARVVETETAREVDEATALRLRLLARYRDAVGRHRRGEEEAALESLRRIADEAEEQGADLPDEVATNLRRAREGLGPLLPGVRQPWDAPPEEPPAPPPSETDEIPPIALGPFDPGPDEPSRTEFGVPPGVRAPALEAPGAADRQVSLDFQEVDIRLVLKMVSELSGINFLVDDGVKGNVTLISPTRIRLRHIYDVLESILEIKGFAAVPSEQLVKVVPRAEAGRRHIFTRVGADPAAIPLHDSVVTQILPIRYAPVSEMLGVVTPMISRGAHIAAHAETNSLLITDSSSNIHQIARIIQRLDVPGAREETAIIRLRHASAEVIARQVNEILQQPGGGSGPSARRAEAPRPAEAQSVSTHRPAGAARVMPEPRTNALIVIASGKDMEMIRALVAMIDVERPREADNLHVVYLENAEAKKVAEALSTIVAKWGTPGGGGAGESILITADEGTNALIIIATPPDFRMLTHMIERLDIVREQVLVEMLIMEVADDNLREIGVEWNALSEASQDSLRGFGLTDFGLAVESAAGDLEGLSVGAFKEIGGRERIAAIIKLLEQDSRVNILSRPQVLTSNHQPARILVGEEIPYVRDSRVTEVDPASPTVIRTFDFKDVGIRMEITPHVSRTGLTRLNIESEFTSVIEGAPGVPAEIPTTAKREAKTVVTVADGATVVLGGLIRDDKSQTVRKVPFFGDIPWLGVLFRRTRTRTQKTNLLIFITPHVLTTEEDIQRITERLEREMPKRRIGNGR